MFLSNLGGSSEVKLIYDYAEYGGAPRASLAAARGATETL